MARILVRRRRRYKLRVASLVPFLSMFPFLPYMYLNWKVSQGLFDQESPPPPPEKKNDRYLVFLPIEESSQGIGNIVAGLLAAHLLGLEFDRTVCVSPRFESFLKAFEPIHPIEASVCNDMELPPLNATTIDIINFLPPPDECLLQRTLSGDEKVLYFRGNSYPRWPTVPPNFFFQYYRPTQALLKILNYPAGKQPHTVVHLRQPDGPWDKRKGLTAESLGALGHYLAGNRTYLVTNRVEWYDYFESNFHWDHPSWVEVRHSAGERISWGKRPGHRGAPSVDPEEEILQTWGDWYTILRAKRVFHTHSDFSISAIHWMNVWSKTIMDYDKTNKMVTLIDESWIRDGETKRLADRTRDELRLCKGTDDDAVTVEINGYKKTLRHRHIVS